MKMTTNAANKWKTIQLANQFDRLLVYSDYNPGSGIIGTPYLNQAGKIVVESSIRDKNNNTIYQGQKLASVVKVCTSLIP